MNGRRFQSDQCFVKIHKNTGYLLIFLNGITRFQLTPDQATINKVQVMYPDIHCTEAVYITHTREYDRVDICSIVGTGSVMVSLITI